MELPMAEQWVGAGGTGARSLIALGALLGAAL